MNFEEIPKMKRKIIRQGHNTLTITLPTDWAKKLNLNAGDEVDLIEDNSSLVINGKQHNGFKTTTIDITQTGTSIFSTKITIDSGLYFSKDSGTQPVVSSAILYDKNKILPKLLI